MSDVRDLHITLTDGASVRISAAVLLQDKRWQEHWRDLRAARAAKVYGEARS